MKIEWLIGFYMLVCISMIVFNFAFLVAEKIQTKRLTWKRRKIANQLQMLVGTERVSGKHLRTLERSLKMLSGLESFDLAITQFKREHPENCRRYLEEIAPALERLAHWYSSKSALRCAFCFYVIGRHYAKRPADPELINVLLTAIRTRPFYARQNALTAIASIGSARSLAEAVAAIDRAKTFHHPKLITEALLAFPGNRADLAREFIDRFLEYRPETQAAIINFGRMADIDYLDKSDHAGRRMRLRNLMLNPETDMEVRLSCIRFFTRDPWKKVAKDLRRFAAHDEAETWEYAVVAASALAKYPGKKTVKVLKNCLRSRIWHVRHNAAQSLRELGVGIGELQDILDGNDRFARETVLCYWGEDA